MWSQALGLDISPHYLMNPKPGEKRNFFQKSRNLHKTVDTVPYIIMAEIPPKPLDFTMGNHFVYKFGSRMPFKVPPLKMPPIVVGGFVGAKSQSFREDTGKSLWDILTNTCKDILHGNSIQNFGSEEELVPHLYPQNTVSSTSYPLNNTTADAMSNQQNLNQIHVYPLEDNMETVHVNDTSSTMSTIESEKAFDLNLKNSLESGNFEQISQTSTIMTPVSQEDQGKPPIKKPKLALKTRRKSLKKRGKRKKIREENVQCDTVVSLPGYDPFQTSFETFDEIDCGIVLSNRFSPLENSSDCESPTNVESSPILNMLNQMHLDDFEVDFDSTARETELCDVHSYKQEDSHKPAFTCNSSIAFILSGNDDMSSSDSEDDCFVSNLEDAQWQSFKSEFEFFQGNNFKDGSVIENCDMEDFEFNVELDNVLILNELDWDDDGSDRLRAVNRKWNKISEIQYKEPKSVKVHFAPECSLARIHSIPSGLEEREARKSKWDQCYLDQCRFQNRIQELEPRLSLIFKPQHRKAVFERLYGSSEVSL